MIEVDRSFCKYCTSNKYIKEYTKDYENLKDYILANFNQVVDYVNAAMINAATVPPDFVKDCLAMCDNIIHVAEFNYRRTLGYPDRYERFTKSQFDMMACFLFANAFNSVNEDLKNAQVQSV